MCFLATMLVIKAFSMTVLVAASTQSDNTANAITSDCCADKTTQQQQSQQQQQPNLQHQQQQFSSNLAPDLYAFLDKIPFSSQFPLSNTNAILQHSFGVSDSVSKLRDANGLDQTYDSYPNDVKTSDLLFANGGNSEPRNHGNKESLNGRSLFISTDEPSSFQYFPEGGYTVTPIRDFPYLLGKRTIYSFHNDDLRMAENKKGAPMFVGRRDQADVFQNEHVFPYNHVSDLALWEGLGFPPSHVAEASKMAKGRVSKGSALNSSDKRGPPRFVGKRESVFETFTDGSSTLVHKRRVPKFVGKRQHLLFQSFMDKNSLVGHKRAAPKFVGKRESMIEPFSEGNSFFELKRGAPRFVGKRRAPFFVGKRPLPGFFEPDVASLEYSADELMNLQHKMRQLKEWDVDDSTYYSNKRGAPRFVGKRLAGSGYSVGGRYGEKRRAPKFVGRSAPLLLVSREQPRFGEEQSSL